MVRLTGSNAISTEMSDNFLDKIKSWLLPAVQAYISRKHQYQSDSSSHRAGHQPAHQSRHSVEVLISSLRQNNARFSLVFLRRLLLSTSRKSSSTCYTPDPNSLLPSYRERTSVRGPCQACYSTWKFCSNCVKAASQWIPCARSRLEHRTNLTR